MERSRAPQIHHRLIFYHFEGNWQDCSCAEENKRRNCIDMATGPNPEPPTLADEWPEEVQRLEADSALEPEAAYPPETPEPGPRVNWK